MPELSIVDSQPLPDAALKPSPFAPRGSVPDMVTAAADKFGVPQPLAHAVVQMESNYNPRARSGVGAMGVMQLMPGTAQSLGVKNPWDAQQNIDGGMKYLAQLSDQFGGDPRLVMAAYNAGPGAVNKYGGVPPYRETQNYVSKGARLMASNAPAAPQPTTGTASRLALADQPAPSTPSPQAAPTADAGGATGSDDIMSRIMRGEQVQVTPSDILRIAFGPTGAEQAPTLSVAKSEPLSIAKSEPLPTPPPAPPPQPPALERAWNAFTGSSGLQTLAGLSSAFPALAGRLSGMPDYANEQRFKNAVTGLYQGVVNEPWRIGSELQKYSQAMLRGDVNEAADHLWFTIPFLGAAGAQMKEYLERGDYAGAAGHAAGVLGSAAVATPEGRAAVAEAPAAVVDAAAKVPEAISNIPGAAGDAATFVKGAVPAAAKAAAKRPPVGAALLGQMVGGPKGAVVAATIAKAPSVIRAAVRGGRAALDAATEAEAVATPGQTYAASQGIDWASLSAADQLRAERLAEMQANAAQAGQSPRVMSQAEAAQVFPDVELGEPATSPAATPQAAPVVPEPIAAASEIPAAPAAPTFLQNVLDQTRGFLSRMPGVSLGDLQGILDRVRSRLSAQPDLEETVSPRPAGRPPGPAGPPGPVMSRAQRRATVMPPEEGIPEQVTRAQAEREAIIGKPRDQWTNADVLAADALRAEGYTGSAQQISRPIATQAAPAPQTTPISEPAPVPQPQPATPAATSAQALYDELKRSGTLEPEPAPAEKPAFEQRARDAKVDKLYDLITSKQVPQSWVQRFTQESWRILAHEVGVPEPSAATIRQLKARLAEYYRPRTLPATTPAEAQAAFDAARARVQ